jgi:poly(hydroxyalkanoate) depolymerase family esterase
MARALTVLALLAGVLVAAALPVAGQERLVRGLHDGRAYRLFVPATVTPARPLVIGLHGCAQTPDDFALGTRLNKAAGRRGLPVFYPAQSPFANPARCWNWFDFSRGPAGGETGEILTLVREVARTNGLDASRLVVIGFSAGGYMAINVTCAAPTMVVGVGIMAGGPYRCAESALGAVTCMRGEHLSGPTAAARCPGVTGHTRASLWHGDGDSVVSPANLTALAAMFAKTQGSVAGAPESVDGATRTPYRAQDRVTMETWLVRGMGHAWSGGDPRGSHTFPSGPDATEAMLRFLVD